jgi:DNA modification methylase
VTEPFYADPHFTLYLGDCLEVMRELPAESVDAVVTDPPYGLEFMGQEWDRLWATDETRQRVTGRQSTNPLDGKPRYGTDTRTMQAWHEAWAREAFRLLKPGGHLLSFGGTRTYHRLTCAIEDAGFEIRDCLCWCYASGFPKSLAPYRSIMSEICPFHASAPHAVRVSAWLPLDSPEVKEPTALALAEIQPEGELLLLIRTGAAGDTFRVTATSLSAFLRGDTNWNIASSWDAYSAERWAKTSTSIIEMATRAITVQGIWNSLASPRTPIATQAIASRPDGCKCAVLAVVESLTDGSVSTSSILWPSAHEPATSPLARLRGLGTAAKPAWEPLVMARKPLRGTVAANVLAYGVGALNIDATRIPGGTGNGHWNHNRQTKGASWDHGSEPGEDFGNVNPAGARWPPNLLLTDAIFDGGVDGVVGGGEAGLSRGGFTPGSTGTMGAREGRYGAASGEIDDRDFTGYGDTGTYSRFFLVPKSSRSDREPLITPEGHDRSKRFSTHPTVKPVALMEHLLKLVTPPGGLVLDMFAGSGSTLIAATMEGFRCIGVEKESSYVEIIMARMAGVQRGLGLDVPAPTRRRPRSASKKRAAVDRVDLELFSGVTGPTEGDEVA